MHANTKPIKQQEDNPKIFKTEKRQNRSQKHIAKHSQNGGTLKTAHHET